MSDVLKSVPFDPKKIATYDLTDIYIGENGEVTIKGLAQAQTKESDGKAWLSPEIPPEVEDIDELKEAVYRTDANREKNKDDVSFTLDFSDVRFRVSVIESVAGKWYTLRKINPPKRLSEFNGLNPILRKLLIQLGSNGSAKEKTPPLSGLVLIDGPTGSGKTTFAGALLQEYLLAYGGVAITIEDPPEVDFPETYLGGKGRVFQTEVVDGDFAKGCQNSMRYSPRYILLGEVRDGRAAAEAIRAAINGHLVITTIHAGSIKEGVDSLIRLAGNDDGTRSMLAQGLRAVLDVRLQNLPGGGRSFLINSMLCPPTQTGKSIAAMIEEGKTKLLVTPIEQQENRMKNKKKPVDWFKSEEEEEEEEAKENQGRRGRR